MRKLFALFSVLFLSITILPAQTIWVANNNPGASGGNKVTTSLQAAIDSASAGDIIHVIPSSVSYGDVTVNKSLTIFGIGTNPTKEGPTQSTTGNISINNGTTGVSNVVISGLRVNSRINIADGNNFTVTGLLIENSYILGDIILAGAGWGSASLGNVTIRSNIIGSAGAGGHRIHLSNSPASNISIINNIISVDNSTSRNGIILGTNIGAVITNNLFLGASTAASNAYAFNIINTATIKNNTFYGVPPNAQTPSNVNGCTFLNNLSFGGNTEAFPAGADPSNQIVDPQLINVTFANSWSFTYDPHITPGGPAEFGGDDGSDIGLTGGSLPFNFAGTNLPLIQQVNIPSAIIQGNTLPTTIKATGN